jgi:hypothetical protein
MATRKKTEWLNDNDNEFELRQLFRAHGASYNGFLDTELDGRGLFDPAFVIQEINKYFESVESDIRAVEAREVDDCLEWILEYNE